jgi:hypothetical protein
MLSQWAVRCRGGDQGLGSAQPRARSTFMVIGWYYGRQ